MSKADRIVLDIELADGRTFANVAITNPVMVEYDTERKRMGYPTHKDAPMFYMTYLAWAQLCKNGDYPREDTTQAVKGAKRPSTFPDFRDRDCLYLDNVEHQDQGDDADPLTQSDQGEDDV